MRDLVLQVVYSFCGVYHILVLLCTFCLFILFKMKIPRLNTNRENFVAKMDSDSHMSLIQAVEVFDAHRSLLRPPGAHQHLYLGLHLRQRMALVEMSQAELCDVEERKKNEGEKAMLIYCSS